MIQVGVLINLQKHCYQQPIYSIGGPSPVDYSQGHISIEADVILDGNIPDIFHSLNSNQMFFLSETNDVYMAEKDDTVVSDIIRYSGFCTNYSAEVTAIGVGSRYSSNTIRASLSFTENFDITDAEEIKIQERILSKYW